MEGGKKEKEKKKKSVSYLAISYCGSEIGISSILRPYYSPLNILFERPLLFIAVSFLRNREREEKQKSKTSTGDEYQKKRQRRTRGLTS